MSFLYEQSLEGPYFLRSFGTKDIKQVFFLPGFLLHIFTGMYYMGLLFQSTNYICMLDKNMQ